MSNWQEELADTYIDGTYPALYDSIPDAIEKAAFYLTHEDIRTQISSSGREKFCRNTTYNMFCKKYSCLQK